MLSANLVPAWVSLCVLEALLLSLSLAIAQLRKDYYLFLFFLERGDPLLCSKSLGEEGRVLQAPASRHPAGARPGA
jgi:hypothetical protein